jgi:hypothetical protein
MIPALQLLSIDGQSVAIDSGECVVQAKSLNCKLFEIFKVIHKTDILG